MACICKRQICRNIMSNLHIAHIQIFALNSKSEVNVKVVLESTSSALCYYGLACGTNMAIIAVFSCGICHVIVVFWLGERCCHVIVVFWLGESCCHVIVVFGLGESYCHVIVVFWLGESCCHVTVVFWLGESYCHVIVVFWLGEAAHVIAIPVPPLHSIASC